MSKQGAKRLLQEARSKISNPKRWIRYRLFDGQGGFCMLGAIRTSATGKYTAASRHLAQLAMEAQIGSTPMPVFNDLSTTTHKDVMEVFDKAIGSLSGDE